MLDKVVAGRIEALETLVAHQDATIEDLNATITAQWRKIDKMARDLAALTERFDDISRRETDPAQPPHY